MRITGWHADAFGHLRDVGVDGLGPHVTVVVGPNESGKTTTHHLLRWVLFGFPLPQTDVYKRYKPADGTYGGRVVVGHGEQLVVVGRHATDKEPTLTAPGGGPAGVVARDLVGHASLGLYERVFAIGVDDLQGFGSLDDDEVRERIFAAGTAGGGRSARAVVAELAEREKALLSPRKGRIRELRKALVEADAERRAAAAQAADLPARRDEAGRLADEAAALRADRDRVLDHAARLGRVLELWPTWAAAVEARAELADLGDADHELGPDPLGRLADELAAVEAAEEEVRAAVAGHDEAVADLGRLEVDEALDGLGPRVDTAVAEADAEVAQAADADRLAEQEAADRADLDRRLAAIGPDWTTERLAGVDVSLQAVDAVERAGAALTGVRARVADAERTLERATAEATVADERLAGARQRAEASAPQLPPGTDLDAARAALRQLRTDLPALAADQATAEERAAVRQQLAALTAASGSGAASGLPSWLTPLAWICVAVLVVGAVVAAVAGSPVGAAAAAVGAVVVAVLAVGIGRAGAADRGDRTAGTVAGAATPPGAAPSDGAGGIDDERARAVAAAAAVVGLPAAPTTAAVDDLLDAVEAARTDAAAVAAAVEAAGSAAGQREQAEADLIAARDDEGRAATAWQGTCGRCGLPDGIEPETAAAMVRRLESAREAAAALDRLADDLRGRRRALDDVRARRAALLAEAGLDVSDDDADAVAALRALAERCAADRDARQRREVLATEVAHAERHRDECESRLTRAREALQAPPGRRRRGRPRRLPGPGRAGAATGRAGRAGRGGRAGPGQRLRHRRGRRRGPGPCWTRPIPRRGRTAAGSWPRTSTTWRPGPTKPSGPPTTPSRRWPSWRTRRRWPASTRTWRRGGPSSRPASPSGPSCAWPAPPSSRRCGASSRSASPRSSSGRRRPSPASATGAGPTSCRGRARSP